MLDVGVVDPSATVAVDGQRHVSEGRYQLHMLASSLFGDLPEDLALVHASSSSRFRPAAEDTPCPRLRWRVGGFMHRPLLRMVTRPRFRRGLGLLAQVERNVRHRSDEEALPHGRRKRL
jgi:hypothetical protein